MVHARCRQRLSNEPRDLVRIRRELELHRDAALKRDIHGPEHHAHAATAQLFQKLILAFDHLSDLYVSDGLRWLRHRISPRR